MRVIVNWSERCTHSESDGKQYGSWSESYDYEVEGVRVASKDEDTPYGSEGYLLPDGSDKAHVVWIRYSTGDSFGRADGKGSIIGVFGDRSVAEAAMKAYEEKSDDYSIEVTDDFGRKIKLHNPAAGYFESLDSLNLDTYSLGDAPIRRRFR